MLILQYDFSTTTTAQLFGIAASPITLFSAVSHTSSLFSGTSHAHRSIFSYQPHQHSILRHPPRPPVYFQPHHHSILITPTSLFPAISHTSILFSSRPPVYFRLSATPALYSHHAHRSIPSCQPHKHSILRHLLLTLPISTRLSV